MELICSSCYCTGCTVSLGKQFTLSFDMHQCPAESAQLSCQETLPIPIVLCECAGPQGKRGAPSNHHQQQQQPHSGQPRRPVAASSGDSTAVVPVSSSPPLASATEAEDGSNQQTGKHCAEWVSAGCYVYPMSFGTEHCLQSTDSREHYVVSDLMPTHCFTCKSAADWEAHASIAC